MTTIFSPSYLESLTFDQLRITLDDMQVRYSLRKDVTREYLLQVLKRHLDKMNTMNTATIKRTGTLESIQEEANKENFPVPEHKDFDFLKEIKQGNSSAKQSQQHTPTHQTPRQIRYPSLQGSAYSISGSIIRVENGGTPIEEKFSYSRESVYATIQKPKHDESNLLSAPLDALYNDIAADSAKKSEVSERSVRVNREIASLRKPDPVHMRQSINKSFDLHASLYQEMFEDNRNCYSDTHLIRGPVQVNYPELQRYKEESTQESIRFRAPEPKEIFQSPISHISEARTSKRESFGSAQKARILAEEMQEVNNGGARKGKILALVAILVIAIMLFAARVFVPKMFYDKRTPVIFSEAEVENVDFVVQNEGQ